MTKNLSVMDDNQPDSQKERDIEEIKYDKEIRILQGVVQNSFVWAINSDSENKDPLTVQGVVSYNIFLMDQWSLYDFLGKTEVLTEGLLQGLLYRIWQSDSRPEFINIDNVSTTLNPDVQSRLRVKFGSLLFDEYRRLQTQKIELDKSRESYSDYDDYFINEVSSKVHPSWKFQIYRLNLIVSALGYNGSAADLETWFSNTTS